MADNGDSSIEASVNKYPRVSIRKFWCDMTPSARVEVLNECSIIDEFASNYLELADLMERWCQQEWEKLPRKVRGRLGSRYGMEISAARARIKQVRPRFRRELYKRYGIKPLKCDEMETWKEI